jgi:hypothetical protein
MVLGAMVYEPSVSAQSECVAFRAVGQARFPSPIVLNPIGDVWGGNVFASIGMPGAESTPQALIGVFSGADAADYSTDVRQRTFGGMGLDGAYTFAFLNPMQKGGGEYVDTFTVTLGRAVWNIGPGQAVGDYQASGRLKSGSGRFEGATGHIVIHGAFFITTVENPGDPAYPPEQKVVPFGRWIPEVEGQICGMK